MRIHSVKVYPAENDLPKIDQLAWKLAQLATDAVPVEADVADMVINRMIDNASVAVASVNREPVVAARSQAMAFTLDTGGGTVFGLPNEQRFNPAWAAWANGVAVRELDWHDTFLAADYSHPGDNIPPVLAVAQHCGCDGDAVLRGIVTAYEVHINLVKAICLHKHKIDHIAHLCPAQAAGIGTLLGLDNETIFQAINQAVHVSFSTRQSRKGEISSWKAYAPAHAGKLALEAVDRAMRGESSPSPIYEGEDSVIAWMLDGPDAEYDVPLPEAGEPKRAILESYTKEHSAEYQAQALIDLAFRMREQIADNSLIEKVIIHTSHHTHNVIGTGAKDPQKLDPKASRETLDHSIMYIFAVAFEDGRWHHVDSYTPERAGRAETIELWHKIETQEDAVWTERYHTHDPQEKAFGGRVEIIMKDGTRHIDELAVANAHPLGASPWKHSDYVGKFNLLAEGIVTLAESGRFLELVQKLPELTAEQVCELNVQLDAQKVEVSKFKGLF